MATLFQLTGAYRKIYEMDELDPFVWFDTLESIDGEIEDKADGYAQVLTMLKADEEAINNEINRLQSLKKTNQNKQKLLKDDLESAMMITEKVNFKTKLHSFRIQKNPPSVYIGDDILDVLFEKNTALSKYLIEQLPKIDKKAILQDLKSGALPETEDLHLQQTESLRIG